MARPPAKTPRVRLTVTIDHDTLRVIRQLQETTPEIDGASAAVRYLARCYVNTQKWRKCAKT
jgi:hypothetical protein